MSSLCACLFFVCMSMLETKASVIIVGVRSITTLFCSSISWLVHGATG